MWNDIETSTDLLNFMVVAETAAQLVRDSSGQPVSIGVSGSWGTGKSSLVKMINHCLKSEDHDSRFVFIEFNAWLYQGYDDAIDSLSQVRGIKREMLQEQMHENLLALFATGNITLCE